MSETQQQTAECTPRCSFCGQPQREGTRFTEGPGGVCICGECVDICRETVEKEQRLNLEQIRLVLAARRTEEKA